MKAIIFGANGQDGFYLNQLLQKAGLQTFEVSRGGDFIKIDISSFKEVSNYIKNIQPDYIFHLAANSTTKHEALFENHETIATGTLNILESVKNFTPHTKVFISGSGLQFQNNNQPIKETDPFEARDAYAVSRIQSVYASRYFRLLGLKVYVGYFFNHDSPRRSERHMAKRISAFAKSIENGNSSILEIGDVSVIKEWTYAGDIVEAIWLFVNQDEIFEANISSGIGYSIEEWINACFNWVNKDPKKHIITSNNFKAEYHSLVSDASLIHSLGFSPKVSFLELSKMMIESD